MLFQKAGRLEAVYYQDLGKLVFVRRERSDRCEDFPARGLNIYASSAFTVFSLLCDNHLNGVVCLDSDIMRLATSACL
jgi:hypothetical protein